eukprot:CAMPEP_0116135182 /NCGR_PEP_ID=MMETSP0329-20121206/11055_1 /TAXON_ID=697910 /ORGANISM="Pseudo-nitzschia arenysensis, Strain B593" /LENGTH=595 /DNA_ID=CAMNT_0003629967 /DNA_START=94 /DNA_END=1881 /DNA_ORIENTATION=+
MKINSSLLLLLVATLSSTATADEEIPSCFPIFGDLCGDAIKDGTSCGDCARANEAELSGLCTVPMVQRICQTIGSGNGDENDNDNDNGNGSTCVESLKEYCPQSLEPTAIACGKCAQNNVANLMTAGCTIPIVTEFCQALGNPQIPIVVPETVLPTGATEDKPLRVFLQAGQSGCVGQASAQMMNNDPSYDEFKGVQEGVWFAGLKAGQGKGNQANSFFMRPLLAGEASDNGNKMGPEVAIGKRLYDAEGGESPVLIVKYCWGGSNLQKQWNPNTLQNSWDHRQDDGTAEWLLEETGEGGADLSDKTHLYANLIYTVRRSLELLDEANIPYKLSGMFWLQGAADKMRTWREYGEDTISFFEAVRSELGEPNLPMVSEGSTHHNTHTGKVYADSVISGCNSITVSMGIGAPNPDDTECVVGPSNPCMGSTFINYDLMNFYGYDPVISEPEFAFLKPPGASDKEFYWFKSFPTNQHMEYEGKILQGEMLSNAYIRSFTNDNLKPEWLKDDVVEQFPHYPCDPDINNGKPSEGNVCWMDQREDTDLAEATCSEMNYSSLVSSGGTTATMSLRSASSMSMLDTGVRIGAMTALLLLYIQ